MGREVRIVPANWEHPKEFVKMRGTEEYKPLHGRSFEEDAAHWDKARQEWESGIYPSYADDDDKLMPYDKWAGQRPYSGDYMPNWPDAERTHYMMYENTTEGTPISPAFQTPEELARWLADNNASAFAGETASYDAWLRVAKGGYAPSAIIRNGHMTSGVEGLGDSV